MKAIQAWKQRVRELKVWVYALYLAYRDPRVPWYARLVALCVVGYAFSPIDLVPDPIPILGYLDDLVVLPLGIALALKLVPRDVLAEYRDAARQANTRDRPTNWTAAAVIIAIWLLLAALAISLLVRIAGL